MSLKVRWTLLRAALSPKYMHLPLYYNYKKVIDINSFVFVCLFVCSRISTTRLYISGIMWRWSLFKLSLHLSRLHDNSVVSLLSWLPSSMRYIFYLCFIISRRNNVTDSVGSVQELAERWETLLSWKWAWRHLSGVQPSELVPVLCFGQWACHCLDHWEEWRLSCLKAEVRGLDCARK